jgi:hypothetical protein
MPKQVHLQDPVAEKDMTQVSHLNHSHHDMDGNSLAATQTHNTDTEKGSVHSHGHGHGSEGDAHRKQLKHSERRLLLKLGTCGGGGKGIQDLSFPRFGVLLWQ